MKAPDFSYEKPNSIPGILSLLEKDELECQLLAGGQSLMPLTINYYGNSAYSTPSNP